MPCVWLWIVTIRLTDGLPGSSKDLNTAKAEFKTAWKALKARTPPEDFAAAYKAMNIRDDGKGGELPHHRGRVGLTTRSQDHRTTGHNRIARGSGSCDLAILSSCDDRKP